MKKFNTVEDYLEVIAGLRDIVTNKLTSSYYMGFTPIINLARYDNDVLDSMSQAAIDRKPLTERQAELACKIILKYQRQLAAKLVDVSPVEHPVYRIPLRKMDYARRLFIKDDTLMLQFPYTTQLIEMLRVFRKDSQGKCVFNKEDKQWAVGFTEYNLNWLHTWAVANDFEIDDAVTALVARIAEVELAGFAIELTCDGESLDITNCPASMRLYINEQLGGFGIDNLLRLVDVSSDLGFTVEPDLAQVVVQHWGPRFLQLSSHREVRIEPTSRSVDDDFASVLDYAVQANRLPVVIYEPDLSGRMLQRLCELYPEDQILDAGNGKNVLARITPAVKFIYTVKPIRSLDRIPMLIISAGMIFGGDKQIMLQKASKIVYTAAEVYNKSQTGKKVVKIAS